MECVRAREVRQRNKSRGLYPPSGAICVVSEICGQESVSVCVLRAICGPDRDLRQQMLVRIADHLRDARQRRQFLRRPLCVTSRHHNPRLRILPVHAPNRRPRVLVRRRCHCAGVQHDNFSIPRPRGSRPTAFLELPLDGRPVCLRRPAAKILYVKTRHGTIVAAHQVLSDWRKTRDLCQGMPSGMPYVLWNESRLGALPDRSRAFAQP
jgi:hypothetical protein